MNSAKPTFEQMVDLIEGKLSAENSAAVKAQLSNADKDIQADFEWLSAFMALHTKLGLERPQPIVQDLLLNQYMAYLDARQTQSQSTHSEPDDRSRPGFIQNLIASLTFDSQAQVSLAGARSTLPDNSRQLIFSSEIVEVAINIRDRPKDSTQSLLGQIFPVAPVDLTNMGIQLLHEGKEVGIAMANELGEFAFDRLYSGEYRLVLFSERFNILLNLAFG